jgi:hypothetical protein
LVTLLVIGTVMGAGYVLLCAASPVRKCPRCKGRKVMQTPNGHARCRKCKGHGRAPRPGGHVIHRLFWDNAAPWVRQRVREAAERRRDSL